MVISVVWLILVPVRVTQSRLTPTYGQLNNDVAQDIGISFIGSQCDVYQHLYPLIGYVT